MDLDKSEPIDFCNYRNFFPFEEFRQDQETTIIGINQCIEKNGNFLLIAPNGTGKTITSLCGVFPLAFKNNLKILYLCRTNTQNTRIIEELNKISNCANFKKGSINLTALSKKSE